MPVGGHDGHSPASTRCVDTTAFSVVVPGRSSFRLAIRVSVQPQPASDPPFHNKAALVRFPSGSGRPRTTEMILSRFIASNGVSPLLVERANDRAEHLSSYPYLIEVPDATFPTDRSRLVPLRHVARERLFPGLLNCSREGTARMCLSRPPPITEVIAFEPQTLPERTLA